MSKPKTKSVGRPKLKEKDRRQAIEVTLQRDTIEKARAIGGTVSRGIEMSVTDYWRGIQSRHLPNQPLLAEVPQQKPRFRDLKRSVQTPSAKRRAHNQSG